MMDRRTPRQKPSVTSGRERNDAGTSPWRSGLLASSVHALFFVMSYPPNDQWVFAFFSLFPLVMLALRTRNLAKAVIATFCMSTIGFYWLDQWLIDVTLVGYLLLAPAHGCFAAAFVWLLARLRGRDRAPALPGVTCVFLVPILWVGLEMLRGTIIAGGYPWFLLAHPVIAWPTFCQSADIFGTYFISFLVAMVAGFLADVLTVPLMYRGRISSTLAMSAVFFVLLQGSSLIYGILAIGRADEHLRGTPVRIAALQTDVMQDNKTEWSESQEIEEFRGFMLRTLELSEDAENVGQFDLIVWPETMVPGTAANREAVEATRAFGAEIGRNVDQFTAYYDALADLSSLIQTPLLVGASTIDGVQFKKEEVPATDDRPAGTQYEREWDHRYNSAILFEPGSGAQALRYDKMHLTPFGEVIPYAHRWPSLHDWVVGMAARGMRMDLSAGTVPQRFTLSIDSQTEDEGAQERSIVVATPICYEAAIARVCRELVYPEDGRKADVLINLTNDGWFGAMRGGREQHFQIARFRCIENRVPMVRAANTGVSGAIDSSGRVLVYGPNEPPGLSSVDSEGFMLATVQADDRWPWYGRLGDLFGWICLGLTGLILAAYFARRGAILRSVGEQT